MPTTFTPLIRLASMTPLDPAVRNTWGSICDNWLPLIEQAAIGVTPVGLSGTTYTLTIANNAPDQSRYYMWSFTGALGADCTVTVPTIPRVGWAQNITSGGHNVLVTTGIGGAITVLPGQTVFWAVQNSVIAAIVPSYSGQPLVATTGTFSGVVTAAGFSGGPVNFTTGGFSGALVAASFNTGGGSIQGGVIAGTTGTFSGAVTGAGYSGGPVSGTTGGFSGASNAATYTSTGGLTSGVLTGWALTPGGAPAPFSSAVGYGFIATAQAMVAITFYAASDVRLKRDIAPISAEAALDWVMQSRPVTYLKLASHDAAEENAVQEAGFIAQEQVRAGYGRFVGVAECPGMPERIDADGFRSLPDVMLNLSPTYQIAFLTRALQTALHRIAALEDRR